MKPFRFTLEAVRTLRQRQEQLAMEQYAQVLAARQQVLVRLDAIQAELNESWHLWRLQLAQSCPASQAAQAHDYQRALSQRRDQAISDLGVAERRVQAALQAMLAARQQTEIVDKSFENQKARHSREEFRHEQKIMDDLAGRRGSPHVFLDSDEAA